ncbi:type IX secretion system sortase PorU [Candidatus Latescibacterota bacterium]
MKRKHFIHLAITAVIIMIVLSVTGAYAADTTLIESNPDGITISYRPTNPDIDTLYANDKLYTVYSYNNHSSVNAPGEPNIPVKIIFFAAPDGVTPSIEITQSEIITRSNIIMAPAAKAVLDDGGFPVYVYEEEPVSYALSGYKPGTFASLGGKLVIDGIAVWELILHPLLFDASKSSVAISNGFDVKIVFGGRQSVIRSRRIPEYVINRESFFDSDALLKKADTADSPFSSGEWYRIKLSDNGIYGITGAELEEAGFPTGTVPSDEIHMYYGGGKVLEKIPYDLNTDNFREIAIKVDDGSDGVFDTSDRIVFFGEGISRFLFEPGVTRPPYQNYPYADEDKGENAFWLVIANTGTPKRIQTMGDVPSSTIPAITTATGFIHVEQENYLKWIDEYNYESGLEWYWEKISKTAEILFNTPLRAAGKSSILRVAFRNGMYIDEHTKLKQVKSHQVDIKVNDEGPWRFTFNTEEIDYLDIPLNNTLNFDKNSVSFWRLGNLVNESIRLDWVELEYEKELKLEGLKNEYYLNGTASAEKFVFSNIMSSAMEIYNTSDVYDVRKITSSLYNSASGTLTFQTDIPENDMQRYTVSTPDIYLKVSSITKRSNTNLRTPSNGADYIVITHKNFHDQAVNLANWRSRDSRTDPLKTMVVDVEDIYDEFGWGVFDPAAIRDFLKYAWESYTPAVRYCCLIGDTIFKYKNLSENQMGSIFVPTFTEVYSNKGLTTDDFFTWFDENRSPYLSIGRLCVNDKESAKVVTNKIIEYEKTPEPGIWRNRVLWIADDEYVFQGGVEPTNTEFTENIEDLDGNGYIPHKMERKKILLIEYPLKNLRKPDATEDLLSSMNEGYLIVNYIGHGNNDVLAHEYILRGSRDIERINNGGRQSLLLAFSCSVGQFDKPESISLAELMQLRNDGGSVGVIAATRVTYNWKNVNLNKSFYVNLFDNDVNPEHRLGLALRKVKEINYSDENANRYVLFGDPATHLMMPKYDFNVASIDTLYRLEKLDIHGTVTDGTVNIPYEGSLFIKAHGPRIHKTYTFLNVSVHYSVPGEIFYKGEFDISGDSFDASFMAPLDLQSDISETREFSGESKIFLFATGETQEASNVIENFYIGGINPDAPEDNTSPEITINFDGKKFNDGDFIRRQPTLTLNINDDSGINILGNRGHNIKLLIDKTESVVLTEDIKTVNGYTNGTIEYPLPVQSLGEHTFQVTAYDNYNNVSKKTVLAQVVGTESGDVTIMDLLNYPNPMGTNGTTFTFNLNDDARSADIKIYSQAGRLVDITKFSAEYGYNQVYWNPPVVLANGVYFYKITVTSLNGRKTSKIEKIVVMR